MTKEELAAIIGADRSITGFLELPEITQCCTDASSETGWPFPVSGDFKELWIKKRALRHCYFKLYTQSARKFKVNQLNLQQRFSHYGVLLSDMDAEYESIQEKHPAMFINSDSETYKAFGSVVGSGFVYDAITGKNLTGLVS